MTGGSWSIGSPGPLRGEARPGGHARPPPTGWTITEYAQVEEIYSPLSPWWPYLTAGQLRGRR
ncbi:MAG: hypothetical protein ACLRWQ_23295 [Flavonifractor plautii]